MPQSVFDSLVRTLDDAERRSMLLKIGKAATVSAAPMYAPETRTRVAEDYGERFSRMGFFSRLWVTIRAFFTGSDREDVLKRDEVRRIGRGLEGRFPGMFDPVDLVLMEPFLVELGRLRQAAQAIKATYEGSIAVDRGAFFALLGSIEMPEIHRALVERTDAATVFAADPSREDADARKAVMGALDEILQSVGDDARARIYVDARAIHFLHRVSEFPFERLSAFFERREGGTSSCSAVAVSDRLAELANVLYSTADAPPVALLEAIAVFCRRGELDGDESEVEDRVRKELAKIDAALVAVREFNERVPMAEIVRVTKGDPLWSASELPGGEDWFAAYRQFWKERAETRLAAYKASRDAARLARQMDEYFGGKPRCVFLAGPDGKRGDEPPRSRLEEAMSFLVDFDRYQFNGELARPLKTILLEGQFFKKENRVDYVDAYNDLIALRDSIASLEAKLLPDGEYGQAYEQARKEIISIPLKRHRIQAIMQSVDDEASLMVRRAREDFEALLALLGGILRGGFGERYDSLSNLSRIGGKANDEFIRSVGAAKDRIERALTMLKTLESIRPVMAEP